MPSVYLIHAGQAIDDVGVRLGKGKHLLASGTNLLVCLCHVYIIPQVGLVVKIFIGEYKPCSTKADAKAAYTHKE